MAPAVSPTACGIIASPQIRPCRSLVTYPADHVHKVWQERCDLGVGLQVVESNLKPQVFLFVCIMIKLVLDYLV